MFEQCAGRGGARFARVRREQGRVACAGLGDAAWSIGAWVPAARQQGASACAVDGARAETTRLLHAGPRVGKAAAMGWGRG